MHFFLSFLFFLPVEYTAPGHIKAASITSPEAQVLTGPKLISLLNGFISLVDLGLNDCFSGFGEKTRWWCEGLEWYYTDGNDHYGTLQYWPSNTGAVNMVNELALLLTGGRLNSASRSIISDAVRGEGSVSDGLRLAQKLMATTPEFHTSTVFQALSVDRPEVTSPTSSGRRYKAVRTLVFMIERNQYDFICLTVFFVSYSRRLFS